MCDPWEISPEAVKARLDAKDGLVLVDCRTPDEFQRAHIEGAVLLPMQELSVREKDIDAMSHEDIIVYCRTGRRSRIVARFMVLRGCSNVMSMAGGIEAWVDCLNAPTTSPEA
jgi:rhodanese-related sulfurtransferase